MNKENPNINRTFNEQKKVEELIDKIFKMENFDIKNHELYDNDFEFDVEGHYNFAKKMIYSLPKGYASLDSGMPWFAYWVLNIIDISSKSKYELSYNLKLKFVDYLKELQHLEGGFCGYSKGQPHVVSNYAAVMAIISLGIKESYEIIDIPKMRNFLIKMKNNNIDNKLNKNVINDNLNNFAIEKDDSNHCSKYLANYPGSFQMHQNGESDLRATYCALTVAYILNIMDNELTQGVVDNIKKCQSFEGGLGPEPFCEAHGGYSFCGIATLVLMNKLEEIDMNRFLLWLVNKQMTIEGGFQGRTNKLVDSCYSFWQGSVFNMLIMNGNQIKYSVDCELLYDQLALQAYILFACQHHSGGLIDKPGKNPDLFHTNYASAGLSLSQKCLISNYNNIEDQIKVCLSSSSTLDLMELNPIFCVATDKVEQAKNYYWKTD